MLSSQEPLPNSVAASRFLWNETERKCGANVLDFEGLSKPFQQLKTLLSSHVMMVVRVPAFASAAVGDVGCLAVVKTCTALLKDRGTDSKHACKPV